MRVLVVGAGVGGLATARALLARGHEVQVYEQASGLRTTGGALTLWSSGTAVLRDLGVEIDGLGTPLRLVENRSWDGRRLGRIYVSRTTRRFGSPQLCVRRLDLARGLAEGLPVGVVAYGRQCVGVAHDGGGVRLAFADGTTATGDVAVGADGHRSVVRRVVLGSEPSQPTGWATWQGLMPAPPGLELEGMVVYLVGREGLCGMFDAGGVMQWWFDRPWLPDEPPLDSVVDDLRARFGHWADPVGEILRRVSDDGVAFYPHYGHAVKKEWGEGRVTLLGDAAHLMPPTAGQGANQALEDAWVLSRALDGATDVPAALREYERRGSRRVTVAWRVAMAERVNQYRPVSARLLPDGVATALHAWWLRLSSDRLRSP